MNKYTLFLLLVIFGSLANGQNYSWSHVYDGSTIDGGEGSVSDGSGNIYIIGYFTGTIDLDPSAAVVNLVSAGSEDWYVAKYTETGTYLWG